MTEQTRSSKLSRGARRAAPSTATSAAGGNGAAPDITFGGRADKEARPIVLPDCTVDTTVASVRVLTAKNGSVTISLDTADEETGRPIRLRNLLVQSSGGKSDLIDDNIAILEDMAGLQEDDPAISLDELTARLTGARVGLQLIVDANKRTHRPENVVVDGWLLADDEV